MVEFGVMGFILAIGFVLLIPLFVSIVCNISSKQNYTLELLGQGYCPATDSFVNKTPLRPVALWELHRVQIGSMTVRLPYYVTSLGNDWANCQTCEQATFYTKTDYEAYMRNKCKLGAGIPLVFRGEFSGRWIISGGLANTNALVRFNFKRETCKLAIRNITEVGRRQTFQDDLDLLPDSSEETEFYQEYEKFFLKWGTHIVSEVSSGGIASLYAHVDTGNVNAGTLAKAKIEASGLFQKLTSQAAASGAARGSLSALEQLGASEENIQFIGGISNEVSSLQTLTRKKFQSWLNTVDQYPKELAPTIKLEPYYNFLIGIKGSAMRDATIKYLAYQGTENGENPLHSDPLPRDNFQSPRENQAALVANNRRDLTYLLRLTRIIMRVYVEPFERLFGNRDNRRRI